MYNKLLDLEDVIVQKLLHSDHSIKIYLETKPYGQTCLSIDVFKGNTDAGKYQCILVDAKKRTILDILPNRNQAHLCDYFRSYSLHERYQVRFFICDMWCPYVDLAEIFFPHAQIYHIYVKT